MSDNTARGSQGPGVQQNGNQSQHSDCTGRRKALLVGINYFSQRGQLRDSVDAVRIVATFLSEKHQFLREDMVILTDDQQNPMNQPTKANMIRAMFWLVKDARRNDSLFFHYCGHGGHTAGTNGDPYDDVIYPVDFRLAGHILDDEMHKIMVKNLQPGVRVTAVFDCGSGMAGLDLPYGYSTQGVLKQPDMAKQGGRPLLSFIAAYARGDLTDWQRINSGTAQNDQRGSLQGDVIVLWGERQDPDITPVDPGITSWAFVTTLSKHPQQSYLQLLNSLRDETESKDTRKLQLGSSLPLDMDRLFTM